MGVGTQVLNGGHTVHEGCGMRRGWGSESILLSAVMTTWGEKTVLIVVIPHVENGGYMEVGEFCSLGLVVEDIVCIGPRWGRSSSRSRRLDVIQRVHWRVFEAQRGVAVAVTVGCRCPDLRPLSQSYPFTALRVPPSSSPSYSHLLPSALPLRHPWTVPASPVVVIVVLFSVVVVPVAIRLFPPRAGR